MLSSYQSQALFRYNILFTQQVTIEIPNNTNLEAGDLIECNFPVVTTNETKEFDHMQSGLYMIKELCVTILTQMVLGQLSS